jgi:hypothetical protein
MECLLHLLLVSLQNQKKNISGHIFLEDFNIKFHHIKDETQETLTDAPSVSPLMVRGRTPWRRLTRQQHPIQIPILFSKIFHIMFNRPILT